MKLLPEIIYYENNFKTPCGTDGIQPYIDIKS